MDNQRRLMHVLRKMRRYRGRIAGIVALLLIVCAFVLGRYSVYKAYPQLSGQEQASSILKEVGTHIQLPANETPVMATITNAASIRAQQPFLLNAENGDVLIVYSQAQQAILYRPSTSKLIAVGPVYNQPSQTNQSPQKQVAPVASSTATKTANRAANKNGTSTSTQN